jgi:hypothetical protein
MPSTEQVSQCHATLAANRNAVCFPEMVAVSECQQASVVCTSGGTTDVALTITKATNDCKQALDASKSCCAANPSSTVCH